MILSRSGNPYLFKGTLRGDGDRCKIILALLSYMPTKSVAYVIIAKAYKTNMMLLELLSVQGQHTFRRKRIVVVAAAR